MAENVKARTETSTVAEDTFTWTDMKVNGLRNKDGSVFNNYLRKAKLNSTEGFPTTEWSFSLTYVETERRGRGEIFLVYDIVRDDPIWTHLHSSLKLSVRVNITIVGYDEDYQLNDWSHSMVIQKPEDTDWVLLFIRDLRGVPFEHDGSLEIRVGIRLSKEETIYPNWRSETDLCGDFLTLLEGKDNGADVTIIASDGAQFKAHKVILMARSAVFKTMLTGDTAESKSGVIKMDDVSSAAVQSLLRYLYGAELPKFVVNDANHPNFPCVSQLVYLADKYMLDHFKEFFDSNLAGLCELKNPNNAVFLLKLAKLHSLMTALAEVRSFLVMGGENVTSSVVAALEELLEPPKKRRKSMI